MATPSESARRLPDAVRAASPQGDQRRRTITSRQVVNAILELREHGSHSAVQIHAVIRALGLTVVPDPEDRAPRSEDRLMTGPCAACQASLSGPNPPRGHTCW